MHCSFGDHDGDSRKGNDVAALELINKKIKMLGGASALDVPTAQESSSRWLYGLW